MEASLNSIHAYLDEKLGTIATLQTLGLRRKPLVGIYLLQIGVLGSLAGLVGGGIGLGQADAVSEEGFYNLAVAGDADSYTLTATATGSQANDEDCATFTLTELGVKGAAVLEDSEDTDSSDCW